MSSFSSLEASKVFHLSEFSDRSDLKNSVETLSKNIFGENSLYLSSTCTDSARCASAVDAFALDLTNPKKPQLFLAMHYLSKDADAASLGESILKCVTTFEDDKDYLETHVLNLLINCPDSSEILGRVYDKSRFLGIAELTHYVLSSPLKLIIMTDRSDEQLYKIGSKINANISILEVRAFLDGNDKRYFMFDSLYDQLDDCSSPNDGAQELLEDRKKRIERRSTCDTLVVSVSEDDFSNIFMKENRWFPVDIGAGMKDRVEYIAAYRKESEQAITHIAKIQDIKYYKTSGRYEVSFDGEAWEIGPVVPDKIPQDVIFVRTVFGDND